MSVNGWTPSPSSTFRFIGSLYRRGSGPDCKSGDFGLGWFDAISSHFWKIQIIFLYLYLKLGTELAEHNYYGNITTSASGKTAI